MPKGFKNINLQQRNPARRLRPMPPPRPPVQPSKAPTPPKPAK
jgi:hypothetical protein